MRKVTLTDTSLRRLELKFLSAVIVWAALFGTSLDVIASDSKTLVVSISQEPQSLNSLQAESVSYTAQVLAHLNEGLMRYDRRRRVVGGVAERWEVDEETMLFYLRDARWQDGSAVTAQDFMFAWRRLVDPDTASPSANLAAPIKHASEILRGELDSQALGVEAIDDQTLKVSLEHPCGWCLKLFTNSIFYPVNAAFFGKAGDEYGSSLATYLSNGAFQLDDWQRGKSMRLIKNRQYWRNAEVNLDRLEFAYIGADSKTQMNLFRSGELGVAFLDRDSVSIAAELGYKIRTFPTGHLFHIQFSHVAGMASSNINLRRAISLVIDKHELVNRVVGIPGTRITDSMFHDWLSVGESKYISARPPTPHQPDIVLARKLMAEARKEIQTDDLELVLTINDSDVYRRVAEYIQRQLKTHLNVHVAIDPQITQMMVKKWRDGSSDMTLITWPVDVDDPMDQISFMGDPSFRSVFKGLYAGDDMATLYLNARDALEENDRLNAVQQVHELFTDQMTVFPLFETYGAVVTQPNIRGFIWQPVRGYADYRYVQIRD